MDPTTPSTVSKGSERRPAKPYPEFPLYAHQTGRWAAKIGGKPHYFGPWRDPYGALAAYRAEKDDLKAGKSPRSGGLPADPRLDILRLFREYLVESGNSEAAAVLTLADVIQNKL